jgi:hypothetical protein
MKNAAKASLVALLLLIGAAAVDYTWKVIEARRDTPSLVSEILPSSQIRLRLEDLPPGWLEMLLAVEDPNFYHHNGMDLQTPGAGITTITQNLVKRILRQRPEKTPRMMSSPRLFPIALATLLASHGGVAPSIAFGSQEPTFEARHIEKEAAFELDGTPDEVFSLLEPKGRPRWVTSWRFEFLYPPSGEARPGAVVRQTRRSGAVSQIWLLADHEPNKRIKYVIFVAGMETWEFDTRLEPASEGRTRVAVHHRITSLAESINDEVQHFADGFDAYVGRVRAALNKVLDESRDR